MEENVNFFNKDMFYRIIYGGLVGSVSVTIVTPIMNFTNHILQHSSTDSSATKFTIRRAFDGLLAYNSSVVPMTAVSITLNTIFTGLNEHKQNQTTLTLKMLNGFFSGVVAGAIGSIPEAVAQVQQLSTPKPRSSQVIKEVINNNGLCALNRGISVTMLRQGIFTAGFISIMPFLAQDIRKKIGDHVFADLIAASICGFMIGPLTTPWNKLRFEKQKNFHIKGRAPSYFEIIKNSNPKKLMAGWKPRTLMSGFSMFLLHKGKEIIDDVRSIPCNRS